MGKNILHLSGMISEYGEIQLKQIVEWLSEHSGDIEIHINSGGGSVFESIAIHNAIKGYPGKKTVVVDALAGSGASVIVMAADEIVMPENAMMMIHGASTFMFGNAEELRKEAELLDKINSSVKACYQVRFIGNDEELSQMLAEDTWLTAQECKAIGFCDTVLYTKEKEDEEPQASAKVHILNKYAPNIRPTEVTKEETLQYTAALMGGFLNCLEQNIKKEY